MQDSEGRLELKKDDLGKSLLRTFSHSLAGDHPQNRTWGSPFSNWRALEWRDLPRLRREM